MGIFKKITTEIIASLLIILTIFFIFLFLNFISGIITALILGLIILYLLIKTFLNWNKLQGHFYKFKISSLEACIILLMVMTCLIVVSSFNSTMYRAIGENLNVMQKVNIYSKLFKLDKIKLKTMKSLNYKYVTFYYENGEETTVELIKTYLNEVEASTNTIFEKSLFVPLKIVIFKNSEGLRNNFAGSDSADGMFTENENSISIIQYTNSIPESGYKKLFFHEYTHYRTSLYLKNKNINGNVPIWFKEGIAEYIGYEKIANVNFKLKKAINFHELDTEKSFEESDRDPFNTYLQSYLAIHEMINMRGNQIICDILNEAKKTDFYSAFKLKMGMDIDIFEKKINGWTS